MALQRPSVPQSPHSSMRPVVPWSFWDAARAFVIGFVLSPFLLSLLLGIPQLQISPEIKILLGQLGVYSIWVLILADFARRFGRKPTLSALGLLPERSGGYYLLAGLLGWFGILAIGLVLGMLADAFGWSKVQPFAMLPKESLPIVAFLAVGFAPVAEEVIFRGLLQATLQQYLPLFFALLLTTIIFSLFHSLYYPNLLALAYVLLLGLLLGLSRHVTGSVYPGILAHFLNNLIAAKLLFHPGGVS